MRFCAQPHCSTLVHQKGYCPTHQRTLRPTAHHRGYTARWHTFRTTTYPDLLLANGIIPACGASLSRTPSPHSHCVKADRITIEDLHLDHEPPLQDWERSHPNIVCDPQRVGFLCAACHGAKTRAEIGVDYATSHRTETGGVGGRPK